MNIILLGLPGAGKGTQAEKISNEFDLPHIATGDIFRDAIKNETPLGKEAKKYIDQGELVPDEVTIGIVRNRLQAEDCQQGFILDGFPRTINQTQSLTEILEDMNRKIDLTLYIEVDEERLVKRLSGRRICKDCGATYHLQYDPPQKDGICDKCGGKLIQRSDDEEETVRNRIKVNRDKLMDIIEYYHKQGSLQTVDGNKGIDAIFSDIMKIIEETC